ncbi:hypothetical protein MNV49_001707 [Pseudohyphozyma bogoriensis]|nr:hypothetical protein MNV49_001707 [Pseudohyphozyma bogoriensis]
MSTTPQTETLDLEKEGASSEAAPPATSSRRSNWFRHPYFQTVIVGICAFCAPGIWGAITSTGAGGTLSTTLVNGVDAFSVVLTATFAFFGPWVVNLVGFRWALVIATYGYCLYSAGLYYHQVSNKDWLLWFGTLLCGTSGGIFWAVEPAIVLGYSEPKTRGTHLAIWISLTNLGGLTAGAINLGFNAKVAVKGALSDATYITLIAIAASGPFWALLLSNPSQVRRSDGTPVEFRRGSLDLWTELKSFGRLFKHPYILAILPLGFSIYLSSSYTGTYLALYFSIRARALGSFLSAIVSVLFATLSGVWLDSTRFSLATRSRVLFIVLTALSLLAWIWLIVMQSMLTGYASWLVAELTEDHEDLFRGSAIVRAMSGYGDCLGFGLGASSTLPHIWFALILFFCFLTTIPTGWYAARKVGVGRKPIQPVEPHSEVAVKDKEATSVVLAGVVGNIPVHADASSHLGH